MGNTTSAPDYYSNSNNNNNSHYNNTSTTDNTHIFNEQGGGGTLSSEAADFAANTLVPDVDIASIRMHLRAGKPSREFLLLDNEDLDEGDETIEAQKLYNREKNRYTNILPCDSTRVKLTAVEGIEGSDYINANFINGETNGTERAYIATQGPLMHTRSDFWRMVWENKCKTVVMLGKERENDRVKCDRYWPEPGVDGPLMFGPLVVRAVMREDDSYGRGIIVRRLELQHTPTNEVRPITHYQYEGWPDHGVPSSATTIRHLVHLIEKDRGDVNTPPPPPANGDHHHHHHHNNNGHNHEGENYEEEGKEQPSPVVVHCSAGVGRTGTFCTIHMTLVRLHSDLLHGGGGVSKFNLYNTVLKLRRQRPGMVQQQEQYVFCYEAVVEEAEELGLIQRDGSPSMSL